MLLLQNRIIRQDKRRLLLLFSFIALILIFVSNISAQVFEDFEEEWEDEIEFTGQKKSASRAIIFSSIFPGAGHVYANPKSLGTYLFPIIEIALWAGYFYYNNEGDRIEKDYMSYADDNYKREYFHEVKDRLIDHSESSNIYNEDHFRLDDDDTQHFYEDIGKYNKYIFGWTDWYAKYVHPDTREIRWAFDDEGLWLGNYPSDVDGDASYDRPYSRLRQKYIQMRHDAQDKYDVSYLMSFGLAFNRIISSLDAVRVTKNYNRELRYSYDINLKVQPDYTRNLFTPMINLVLKY